MILGEYNPFRSKVFLAVAAISGLVVYSIEKNSLKHKEVLIPDDFKTATVANSNILTYMPKEFQLKNSIENQRKNPVPPKYKRDKNTKEDIYANAMMHADKAYQDYIKKDTSNQKKDIKNSNDGYIYSNSKTTDTKISDVHTGFDYSIATVMQSQKQTEYNKKIIRTTSSKYDRGSTREDYILSSHKIEIDDTKIKKDVFAKKSESILDDSDDSSVMPGYISGSAIPSEDINTSNLNNKNNQFSKQTYFTLDSNRSLFSVGTKEEKHECYFDSEANMKCKKTLLECTARDNLGLECFATYYYDGFWYKEPYAISIDSDRKLIKKHLELKTSFAKPKFDNYYAQRQEKFSLIRADLNSSKSIKLVSQDNNSAENKTFGKSIATLLENNDTRTSNSILLRGTLFGTGHEKIQGGDSELLFALREFITSFVNVDDSDIYGNMDYWALMDDKYRMGDSEDFALTAMEWLLVNGVDPKYISLAEIVYKESESGDVVLLLETQDPKEIYILKSDELIKAEEGYFDRFADATINFYKYID